MHRALRSSLTILVPLMIFGLTLFGCSGGHGPSLPSPDGGGDSVETDNFVVEAGETVRYDTDTVIHCDTAAIDGEIIGADGLAPGEDGVSVTIQAQGDVTVTGSVRAGSGAPGDASPNQHSQPGDGSFGADGGSVSISSAEGGITLAEGSVLWAGDGGDGGEGLTGGAGGKGGGITLDCPNGTLAITQSAGMFHLGGGGDGGDGVVEPEDLPNEPADLDLPNRGGDGGAIVFYAASAPGIEWLEVVLEDAPDGHVGFLGEGVLVGDGGGDAGDYFFCADPETGEPVLPLAIRPMALPPASGSRKNGEALQRPGARGGDGPNGTSGGDGGNISAVGEDGGWEHGYDIYGGDGGRCILFPDSVKEGWRGPLSAEVPRGGHGGWAKVDFRERVADGGGRCEDGLTGQDAFATGGHGGWVYWVGQWQLPVQPRPGNGGSAGAKGGMGGPGGHCCPTGDSFGGRGGVGGEGGRARAQGGGAAGFIWATKLFAVDAATLIRDREETLSTPGSAYAEGGTGGPSGRSLPQFQVAGGPGGTAEAEIGYHNGPVGDAYATAVPGRSGEPGDVCHVDAGRIGLLLATPGASGLQGLGQWIDPGALPAQLGNFSIGGDANPIVPGPGDTMDMAPDNSILWVSSLNDGIMRYDNPLTGGDRPPDLLLTRTGGAWNGMNAVGLWYDEQRDVLYACWNTNEITAWVNASQRTANGAPDRVIVLNETNAITSLDGDAATDRLFIARENTSFETDVARLDNASQRNGANPPDTWFPMLGMGRQAIAYDAVHDTVYVPSWGPAGIIAIDGASLPILEVPQPRHITGPATTLRDPMGSMVVFGDLNLLIVQIGAGNTVAFAQASTLDGDAAPFKSEEVAPNVNAMTAWYAR